MSAVPRVYLTPAEYLALERKSETKSEYFDGEIFAIPGRSRLRDCVAGASQNHVTIMMNTSYLLVGQDGGLWLFSESVGLDGVMAIESIECQLPLADVYDRVDFSETPPTPMLTVVKEQDEAYAAD